MLTELFSVFHPIGTTPDDLAGWPGNAAIVMATFRTNQKAAQYTLRVVPGGLSLLGILIYIAPPALLSLHQKEVVKADNIANVLLIGKQIAENRLRPAFPAFRGWNIPLEQKISNPAPGSCRRGIADRSFSRYLLFPDRWPHGRLAQDNIRMGHP